MTKTEKAEYDLGEELVNVYRGWHQLEATKKEKGVDVIDIDAAPVSKENDVPVFQSRREVSTWLRKISSRLNSRKPDGRYLRDKIGGSQEFIADLRNGNSSADPLDSPLSHEDYSEATIGVRPRKISPEEMDFQHGVVEDLFTQIGCEFTPFGWQSFYGDHKLNPLEIEENFQRSARSIVKTMLSDQILGISDLPPDYIFKHVNEPALWISWVSMEEGKIPVLKTNYNEVNTHRWYEGMIKLLSGHEMMHVLQALQWRKMIANRELNPALGILTIPGPEQWGSEALATTLFKFVRPLSESLTVYEQFALEYRIWLHMRLNNAQIDFNNGESEVEVISQAHDDLPSESPDYLRKILLMGKNNPVYRAYYVAYRDGTYAFVKMADALDDKEKITFVKKLFEKPMTPNQIKAAFNEIIASRNKQEVLIENSQHRHEPAYPLLVQ